MILLSIEDVSEKRQLERQKDDFISIASHELKTPVTSIKLYAQILQRHPLITSDKKVTNMLSQINQQTNRLTSLVASFMNVYKLGTGKLRLHREHFEIKELVTEVVANFQYTISSHTVEQLGSSKVTVFADRDRINQVLVNLISNAIKYSPNAERIIVKLAKTSKNIIISVKDFGMGIPKEETSRIFERFYRAKGKREGKIPGLGLGLFISAEIVKQHGGTIWVNSIENVGSTFYFTLPISNKTT